MIKTIKVMLLPNNKQNTKLFCYAGASRFAYNWAIAREQENYKNGGKFISDYDLRKEFTQLKKTDEHKWLNDISNNVTKQAIKDCCAAYKRFFNKKAKYPKFKSKKRSKPSFYQDNIKIKFTGTHVKVEGFADSNKVNKQKINWIRLAEKNRIPTDVKYINPRFTFDGLHWWVSVGIEYEDNMERSVNNGIGIDLGVKDLAICSDGFTYKNINKSNKMRKLTKKRRRLQRQVSRKYEKGREGNRYKKTCNIIKAEHKLLKVSRKLTNIRNNYTHQTTTDIINRKPRFVVLENLNVMGMVKNHKLAKAIQEQSFYEFYRQIQYKCLWNNIKFIEADRYFASSKICSDCGAKNTELKLSDRVWACKECGCIHDRDFNASINLMKYGESIT